ncbi:CapA family protein [Allocatelliglobosispora scoriae]|uniref:CapA family protein n=1 Tax=Allocatelliglobosispora scoriae TaxID=643052 RepID=UPI0016109B43|nr:CapA family protein [Allocatelliglobosispora scoriae]
MRALRLLGLLLLTLTGCTAPPPPAAPPPPVVPASSPPARSATIRPVTIAFAGDVHFTERTLPLLDDPESAFGPIATVLAAADLTVVNLESAVTTRGVPEPKTFHFRAPASAYTALKAAGVDIASVANNHALDYGRVGLADTLALADRARFPVVGAGRDAATAFTPKITTVGGTRIALLGVSQVAELWRSWRATAAQPGIAMARDTAWATEAVRAARKVADVVVVYVHWASPEGQVCPTTEMRDLATALSRAGADAVVGTHGHILLGGGWLGRTYVHYGLGNFLWWRDDAASNDTGVLQLTLTAGRITGADLIPAVINRRTGQPVVARGTAAARITADEPRLRACAKLAAAPPP